MLNLIIKHLLEFDSHLSLILDPAIHCPILDEPDRNVENLLINLIKSVIGQQLSVAAAKSIWNRLESKTNNQQQIIEKLSKIDFKINNKYGISKQKIVCIQTVIGKCKSNELNFQDLNNLSDEDVVNELTKIKGIGIWTAEMFLIFSLKRQDVFSSRDAGLVRAVKNSYLVGSTSSQRRISKRRRHGSSSWQT